MPRRNLIFLAFGLALAGFFAFVGYFYERPTLLRISVVRDSEDHNLLFAIAHGFSQTRAPFKLRIIPVENAQGSAQALDSGDVDMAIVRTDIALPAKGQTIAVLHHNAVLLATTREGPASVSDLRGKTVAVLRTANAGAGNLDLFHKILEQYAIGAGKIQTLMLTRAEGVDALREGKVDALAIVAPLASNALTDFVASAGAGERGLKFIAIAEAAAMARRNPLYQSMDVPRAMFSGDPPQPESALATFGVTVALSARASLSDAMAADFLRTLFLERPRIARLTPLANQIEAPDTNGDAPLPVHPGARAYFDNDEQSFMDRYSDYLYISAMLFSFIGTGAAAWLGRRAPPAQARADETIGQMFTLLQAMRAAQNLEELKLIESRGDAILKTLFLESPHYEVDSRRLMMALIVMERAHAVAAARCGDLQNLESRPNPAPSCPES